MIRFAAFSDLHYDHIPDGDKRIEQFISRVQNENLDFVISLGDLCYPIEENKKILERLNGLDVPVYYVIGNHDSDVFSQDEVQRFLNIEKLNYSFKCGDTKFIVLNSCYMKQGSEYHPYFKKNYDKKRNLYPIIPEDEIEWLKEEMADETWKYVIFSHHSLVNEFVKRGIVNREEVREILSKRNTILCMNGHDHGDGCVYKENIPFFTVNSISYIWHGLKEVFVYDNKIHKRYPYLKDMILYKDALSCIVEIDGDNVRIQGMESDYQCITPEEVGIENRQWNGVSIEPQITNI